MLSRHFGKRGSKSGRGCSSMGWAVLRTGADCHAEQVQIYADTSSAQWPAERGCKIISLPIFAKYTILRKQISQQRLFPPTENVSFEQRKESIGFKSIFES